MRFLFDCEDEICLPMAYKLVDEIKPFLEKVKVVDVIGDGEEKKTKVNFKKIVENIMVKYPKETGELLSKLWILEEREEPLKDDKGNVMFDKNKNVITKKVKDEAPNTFKTLGVLFSNDTAIDFFTSVLPSLLTMSKRFSPLLK